MTNKVQPLVSIVITTKNEEKNLGKCLMSIQSQTYPKEKIETIVVDNSSTDKTKEIAKKYTNKVFDKGPERSAQRNFGIKKAKGKYVMYLDADMILSPTVIKKSVEKLENSDLVGLYIPEVILGNSCWSRVRRFERSFYDGTVVDCVRVMRRDVFQKTGGFDLKLIGPEDWDMDKKVRMIGKVEVLDKYPFEEIDNKVMKIDSQTGDLVEQLSKLSSCALLYHNETKFNLKRYFQKKSYYARSFDTYICKWGKNDLDIKKQFGFWYRYFGVFLEKGKWNRLFRYPVSAVGVFLLRFLVGISFIRRNV